jgi:hypothetical protein
MSISIFYSWQSETPENRSFIKNALEKALKNIYKDKSYDLNERLELDHDTKDIPGIPNITDTIFSKITNCRVFVADLSLTSTSDFNKSRHCANPNVLIETGYALSALGNERIILVMNEEFGVPKENIPFNLQSNRWPITFRLASNTDSETRKLIKEKLVTDLVSALTVMIEHGILQSSPTTISSREHDQQIFNKLQIDIPYDGRVVRFLREEDCKNTLFTQDLHEIYNFVNKWNNPHFEFLDSVLEKQRKEFLTQLIILKNELFANTWTNYHDINLSSMELPEDDFGHPRWEKAEEMNKLATKIYGLYESLIRDCKRRIGTPLI